MTKVRIRYCTQCGWMLRATWMAQELLKTFEADLHRVSLEPATGGAFEVSRDGEVIFSRATEGRFPDASELKRLARDRIDPGRSLGHVDGR